MIAGDRKPALIAVASQHPIESDEIDAARTAAIQACTVLRSRATRCPTPAHGFWDPSSVEQLAAGSRPPTTAATLHAHSQDEAPPVPPTGSS